MTCSRSTWSVPDQLQTASTATHRVVKRTSTAARLDRLKRCPATVPAAAAAAVLRVIQLQRRNNLTIH